METPQTEKSRGQIGLYSVQELITMAFSDINKVDFKLIQVIVLVLARRLNVLYRKVHVKDPGIKKVTSDIFIEEVKVHAKRFSPTDKEDRSDYDRDNILVVHTLPGEQEKLQLTRGRMRRTHAEVVKSLVPNDLYSTMVEEVIRLEQKLSIVDSKLPDSVDTNMTRHSKAMLQLAERLEKTERKIEFLSTSLLNLANASRSSKMKSTIKPVNLKNTGTPTHRGRCQTVEGGRESGGPLRARPKASPAPAGAKQGRSDKGQDLVVGYVTRVTKGPFGRTKSPHVTKGPSGRHSSRLTALDYADSQPSSSRGDVKGTRIKAAKPEKGQTVAKQVATFAFGSSVRLKDSDLKLSIEQRKTIFDPAESISKPILQSNIGSLKATLRSFFDDHGKKIIWKMKDVERTFRKIGLSMIDVQPISEGLTEIDDVLKVCIGKQQGLNKESSVFAQYQDELFDMQQTVEDAVEKMLEALANRKSDVDAINQLHSDMASLWMDIQSLQAGQKEIGADERDFCKELKVLLKIVTALNKAKCSRKEFVEASATKAGLSDLNTFMSSMHFAASYADLQARLANKIDNFRAREYTWQRQIDELYVKLYETVGKDQLDVLNQDAKNKTAMLRNKVDFYSSIMEPFKRLGDSELTRARRERKCLCCTSCDVTPFSLPVQLPQEETTVCYPSLPVPKDKRCRFTSQPCQKKEEKKDIKDLKSYMSVNALKTSASVSKETHTRTIDTSIKQEVHIPCKPCNKSSFVYKAKDLPAQWGGK